MKRLLFVWTFVVNFLFAGTAQSATETGPLLVKKCADFPINGKGDHPEWAKAEWQPLQKLDPQGEDYETSFKILYSPKGIYVLFSGRDNKVTTQYDQDFGDLFKGDVFEVFFHPEPKQPLYFEYEINQLNRELVLLIHNARGNFAGWAPWHYERGRVVKKMVDITGGKGEPDAAIRSWRAELFFPNELLQTFSNVPPLSGTVWNANFYRLDYDSGSMVKWAWSPVKQNFHEYDKFRLIKFE